LIFRGYELFEDVVEGGLWDGVEEGGEGEVVFFLEGFDVAV
jgi:hypothetical protein